MKSMRLNWEIEFYVDENGISNVKNFLDGILDKKLKAKVLRDIGLLELMGTELRLPHTRYLEDGIWELRTKQSSNICIILYFSFLNGKLILVVIVFLLNIQKLRNVIRHSRIKMRR